MKSLYALPLAFLLFACAQNKTAMTDTDLEPQSLIVLLKEGVDPQQVLSAYDQIDERSIQLISRSKNEVKCLLKSGSIDVARLLSALANDDSVIRAAIYEALEQDATVNTEENMGFSHTSPRQLVAVTLNSEVDAEKLLSKYEEIDMQSIKLISRSENKVSCVVAISKGDAKEWMKALESEEGVIKVELITDDPDAPSSGTNDGFSKTKPIRD